jgi:hypothetical protein
MPLATRSRRTLPVLIALSLATIAGCGQSQQQQQQQQQRSGLAPAHSLQPIRYTRTGGFAGTHDQLVISPDGSIAVSGKTWGDRRGRLTTEQIAALADAFNGWDALRDHYPALPGVTDYFELTLTYGGKTVTAADISTAPTTFQRAQTLLDDLIRQLPPEPPAETQPTASGPALPTSRSDD